MEQMFADYLEDPQQVPESWRAFFESRGDLETQRIGPSFQPPGIFAAVSGGQGPVDETHLRLARLQERVDQLIRNYRVRGHILASVDPLGRAHARPRELEPEFYGFTGEDLDSSFSTRNFRGSNIQTLRDIIESLEAAYCGAVGVQFMHIDDLEARDWLQRRWEHEDQRLQLTRDQQLRILTKLTDAVIFEEFVRTKYVGAKTFSLEGAETLIPLLDLSFDRLARQGVREIAMGMSHRGRLNVLANIVGKNYQDIFREFEDIDAERFINRGDVKYHLGHHGYFTTASGMEVHVSMGFNPSHLEFVNPVTLGRCRAKQDRFGDPQRHVGAALLVHGDAAFAGEGIVQESLNLSQLPGYTVGGCIHVIVNNQIGFTTLPEESRSCRYCTDVAKMLQIPIFHVNGEDPEAVAQVVDVALDFRHAFHRDVVIDMYCFRRWGHNEGDEPEFTQPAMYRTIAQRETIRSSYLQRLLQLGEVTQQEADEIAERRLDILEHELSLARQDDYVHPPGTLESMWKGYMGQDECFVADSETGVEEERLCGYLKCISTVPDGFRVHRKLQRLLDSRRAMARGEKPLDWAAAELAALASIADEGFRVRYSGQDSQRGTFSHRHAVLHDAVEQRLYEPLKCVSPGQAEVEILNSPLSEAGVLGFEYGYSLAFPDGLVIWEAQFGDFANAAQVIIDQFIASGEDKWRHLSGLVMLLPHGFEGQGPEHSSARLERFLMLAAEDNMQIVVPSTPAQYFHVLRRQVVRPWRKPLIVMTPKSLLRNPKAVSPLADFTSGRYQRVLSNKQEFESPVRRVLACSGKIFYELDQARQARDAHDVAIVRLEQLYPLPEGQLAAALEDCPEGTPVVWVQEEPENMGAWHFLRTRFSGGRFRRYPISAVTRPSSASPATGSSRAHRMEQDELIEKAFAAS
jgi:2-oxoglutarate dehydrogenase E1 component